MFNRERGKARIEARTFRLYFLLAAFLLVLPAVGLPQDGLAPLCIQDEHTLCLNGDRFAVTAAYQQSPLGASVQATAVRLTADTGYFWFFDPSNIELVVKVLNGCDLTNSYWVFAAGLTNVGVNLAVRDMLSGETKMYENPIERPSYRSRTRARSVRVPDSRLNAPDM